MTVYERFKNVPIFGELDAYDSIEIKTLPSNFIPIDAFEQLSKHSTPIICGRKGSGKSALVYMLVPKDYSEPFFLFRDCHFTSIMVEDFNNTNKGNVSTTLNVQTFFLGFWKYLIYLSGMFSMVIYYNGAENNEVKAIQNYLSSGEVNIDIPKLIELNSVKIKEFNSVVNFMNDTISYFGINLVNKAIKKSLKSDAPATNLELSIQERLTGQDFLTAKKAFLSLLKLRKCTILIDNIEKCFSTNIYYLSSLKGMVEAVKNLQDQEFENLIIKCVIPSEIYDDLTYDNPAKYYQKTVFLRWTYKDLLLLLAKRFHTFFSNNNIKCAIVKGDIDRNNVREKFWYKLIPHEIKNAKDFYEEGMAYVIRHTQKKPRQLINLMNYAIMESFKHISEKQLEKKEPPVMGEEEVKNSIHNDDCMIRSLNDALSIFSKEDDISLSSTVRAMFEDEKTILSASDLHDFSKRIHDRLSKKYFKNIDEDQFIETLFRSGLIGVVKDEHRFKDKNGKPCLYFITDFEYLMRGRLGFAKHLKYGLHEILADSLKLKKISDNGIVYPFPERDEIFYEYKR
ncbi:MAG: hypothetical protein HY879_09585 [Deltaproteobacteria bacterium]|nr:hypothetical protein [Deltaproteobacteria bacterium]